MAESICIRTQQGLICYANPKPVYTKKKNGKPEEEIPPPPNTPPVDENSEWWEKLEALIYVARHQTDMDCGRWIVITHAKPTDRSDALWTGAREAAPTSSERISWPIALVASVAIIAAAWVIVSGPAESIARVTDYLLSSAFPVVIAAVFGGTAGVISGKASAERTIRRMREYGLGL